jgi:hypothetical protein
MLGDVLRNECLKQTVHPIRNHPAARFFLFRREIPSIQFCREHFLSGHTRLVESDSPIGSDGIFA